MKIISKVAINASINIVFDLARSMDFHTYSVRNAGESIIDGRMTGLIGLDETVTFKGKHFGFNQIGRIRGLWASDGKFWGDVSCLVE